MERRNLQYICPRCQWVPEAHQSSSGRNVFDRWNNIDNDDAGAGAASVGGGGPQHHHRARRRSSKSKRASNRSQLRHSDVADVVMLRGRTTSSSMYTLDENGFARLPKSTVDGVVPGQLLLSADRSKRKETIGEACAGIAEDGAVLGGPAVFEPVPMEDDVKAARIAAAAKAARIEAVATAARTAAALNIAETVAAAQAVESAAAAKAVQTAAAARAQQAAATRQTAAPAKTTPSPSTPKAAMPPFILASTFAGEKPGYTFKRGNSGVNLVARAKKAVRIGREEIILTGYYRDPEATPPAAAPDGAELANAPEPEPEPEPEPAPEDVPALELALEPAELVYTPSQRSWYSGGVRKQQQKAGDVPTEGNVTDRDTTAVPSQRSRYSGGTPTSNPDGEKDMDDDHDSDVGGGDTGPPPLSAIRTDAEADEVEIVRVEAKVPRPVLVRKMVVITDHPADINLSQALAERQIMHLPLRTHQEVTPEVAAEAAMAAPVEDPYNGKDILPPLICVPMPCELNETKGDPTLGPIIYPPGAVAYPPALSQPNIALCTYSVGEKRCTNEVVHLLENPVGFCHWHSGMDQPASPLVETAQYLCQREIQAYSCRFLLRRVPPPEAEEAELSDAACMHYVQKVVKHKYNPQDDDEDTFCDDDGRGHAQPSLRDGGGARADAGSTAASSGIADGSFIAASTWQGPRKGYLYSTGDFGPGYYKNPAPSVVPVVRRGGKAGRGLGKKSAASRKRKPSSQKHVKTLSVASRMAAQQVAARYAQRGVAAAAAAKKGGGTTVLGGNSNARASAAEVAATAGTPLENAVTRAATDAAAAVAIACTAAADAALARGASVEETMAAVATAAAGASKDHEHTTKAPAKEAATLTASLSTTATAIVTTEGETVDGPRYRPAATFEGKVPGYVFKIGDAGLGYYKDAGAGAVAADGATVAAAGRVDVKSIVVTAVETANAAVTKAINGKAANSETAEAVESAASDVSSAVTKALMDAGASSAVAAAAATAAAAAVKKAAATLKAGNSLPSPSKAHVGRSSGDTAASSAASLSATAASAVPAAPDAVPSAALALALANAHALAREM